MRPIEPTVFIVEDDAAMRDAIRGLVQSTGQAAEAYSSAEEFLQHYDPQRSGCLLLDLRMPGMDGLSLQEHLVEQGSTLPVIVITGHGDVPQASSSFRMGAVDFLRKPFDGETLLQRVQEAIARDAHSRQAAAEAAETSSRLSLLTDGEREVLELLITGASNKEMAFKLGIAIRTVEDRRARIMAKMQTSSLADLVRLILRSQSHSQSA